jgi:hypothetical protein
MLRIQGDCLSKADKFLLKKATIYTMDHLLPRPLRANSRIIINVCGPDSKQINAKNWAECRFDTNKVTGLKTVRIWLNSMRISRTATTPFKQLRSLVRDLFHELVHAKQYLKGELVELGGPYYKFRGKKYHSPEDGDLFGYYDQPYEIEAYGREKGLYIRFRNKMKADGDE